MVFKFHKRRDVLLQFARVLLDFTGNLTSHVCMYRSILLADAPQHRLSVKKKWKKHRNTEKQRSNKWRKTYRSYLTTLPSESFSRRNLYRDKVSLSDLSTWQETLAILSTYSQDKCPLWSAALAARHGKIRPQLSARDP